MDPNNNAAPASTTTETASPTTQPSPTSVGSEVGKTSSGLPTQGEVPNDPTVDLGFEGLGMDHETSQLPSAQPKVAVPDAAKLPPPAVAAPASTAPVAAAPAPAVPPAAVPQPPAQPTAEASASTEAQPVTAEAIMAAVAKNPDQFIENLVPAFAITPEQALELESDYAGAVPKLLANVYAKATITSLDYIQRLVPGIVAQHMHNANLHRQAEEEFFAGAGKGLSRATHGADIISMAKAFTSQNPRIDKKALFDVVGAAVRAKHGITGQPAAASLVQTPGFVPASNSAPVTVSQTPVSEGLFEGLGREYE